MKEIMMIIENHLLVFEGVAVVIVQIVTFENDLTVNATESVQIDIMIVTVQNGIGTGTVNEGMNVMTVIETHIDQDTLIGTWAEGTIGGVGEIRMTIHAPAHDEAEVEAGAEVEAHTSIVQILTIGLVQIETKIKTRRSWFQAI